ncbi:hypothetical protein GQ44DRAFT_648667 [Phaeosphaeriaceae sp. PMI808]|nr:hypothetical protein GQ44DRAFT_648667 [Phaeosphaeriaceae sp. PMI808]
MGMIKNEAEAAAFVTPIRSPWDGGLVEDFKMWGYREIPNQRPEFCNFGQGEHNLHRAFGEMGIDSRSSQDGGPNTCYHIEHKYGPTVERGPGGQWPEPNSQWYRVGLRRLRETEAYTTLGINPVSGVLYLLNRMSPAQAAHVNWDIPLDKIKKEFLPDLSATSDHAWGFWSRAKTGGNLADINKIFSCMITNDITLALIDEALRTYPLPPGVHESQRPRGVQKWPGTTFEMHYDAAQALLGSPNGQAAGFFLAQHKHRFGKSKTIEKITVLKADRGWMPYIIFWVIDAPAGPTAGGLAEKEHDGGNGTVTNRQADRNEMEIMVRHDEHLKYESIVRGVDEDGFLREHVIQI